MSKMQILRKLETILDEMEHGKTWGTVELEVRDGAPVLIRKITTEKIESAEGKSHAQRFSR